MANPEEKRILLGKLARILKNITSRFDVSPNEPYFLGESDAWVIVAAESLLRTEISRRRGAGRPATGDLVISEIENELVEVRGRLYSQNQDESVGDVCRRHGISYQTFNRRRNSRKVRTTEPERDQLRQALSYLIRISAQGKSSESVVIKNTAAWRRHSRSIIPLVDAVIKMKQGVSSTNNAPD